MAQPVLQKLAVCPGENRAAAATQKLFYSRFSARIKAALCTLPLILSLAGCQSYFQRIDDCKTGDWDAMGRTDGRSGEPSNYDDRREFCSFHTGIAVTDSAARYSAGWTKGNWDLWYAMGEGEGRHGSQSQYEQHTSDAEVRDKKTPLNQPAYDAGWLAGNIQYWYDTGRGEGNSGRPLSRKEANRELAAAMPLRFDEASYVEGWHAGNRSFWFDAGFYDAHYGIPDSEFQKRAAAARTGGVDVQEAAYREAWNSEIVVYWRDLGTKDATSGKEFGERSLEAKKKGLKIFEQEYRQAWVARLTDYWRQAGKDDGYGQPFKLDSRIASARHDGVFVIPATRDLYTTAWQEQNTLYCQPENAFQGGVANQNFAIEVCRADLRNQLRHAYVSGQDYKATEARYLDASYDADHLRSQLSDARYDLDRVEREIRNNREAKDRPVTDETIRLCQAVNFTEYYRCAGDDLNGKNAALEARIVRDADMLDAIGAVGIARAFMFGGYLGEPMWVPDEHNTNDVKIFVHGKTSSVVHHFHEKLLKLEFEMLTCQGQVLAIERTNYMRQFLGKLMSEIA